MGERVKSDNTDPIKRYVAEVIEQRALTMEDGRVRGEPAIRVADPQLEQIEPGPDDGEMLG